MFCTACGAAGEVDIFCTTCGARLHPEPQVALTTLASTPAPAHNTPSTASRVWDGVERVGNAVTTVFAVVVGLGWILFGIIVFVIVANGNGNGVLWLIGLGMIIYGIFLIMPTRGTKIIIY